MIIIISIVSFGDFIAPIFIFFLIYYFTKIEMIENDIQSKADSKELSIIENKIYNLEENKKVMNNKLDQLEQHSDKFKKEISNIFKKLENLSQVGGVF